MDGGDEERWTVDVQRRVTTYALESQGVCFSWCTGGVHGFGLLDNLRHAIQSCPSIHFYITLGPLFIDHSCNLVQD